jgi:VanZ family protein
MRWRRRSRSAQRPRHAADAAPRLHDVRAIIAAMSAAPIAGTQPAPAGGPAARASRLPHAMAALYALAIAYASLQPFGEWLAPLPQTPFWALAPWSMRATRFDIVANILAYVPLGFFVALLPTRGGAAARAIAAVAASTALSFAMETLQWFLPSRGASTIDLVANATGALLGGLAGARYARSTLRDAVQRLRTRLALPGPIGDVGLALLAVWLVAQANPAIAPFALTFEPVPVPLSGADAAVADSAVVLIEAAESAFQLVGVGLFVALLVRDRRLAGGAVLLVAGAALLIKGTAAYALLKPAAFESWLSYGALLGIAAGAMLLLPAIVLPRPAQVTICAIALLSSLLTPAFVPEVLQAAAPLTLFNWRYGHLLNFNGLTRSILVAWPLAAALWLFALAGQPGWGLAPVGARDATAKRDPL